MHINFKRLHMHNFLSYGDAEIELRGRNYCLVRGVNRCPLDNALSNGSGKSSWISAICWCLTGETVQGIKGGIKNIYVEEPSCWVRLSFDADGDSYEVTRVKEPSPDMKITKNGQDVSGKGIRESQIVLAQHLPDLNRGLLCSVILLGQGLPTRFTDNTPSGRKEVLERLSKSDFMIEDVKSRISSRQSALSASMRKLEDDGVRVAASLNALAGQLESAEDELRGYSGDVDYDLIIKEAEETASGLKSALDANQSAADAADDVISGIYASMSEEASAYGAKTSEVKDRYGEMRAAIDEKLMERKGEISALSKEIGRLDGIQEVCPTCGRPFEGVSKPDTSGMKESLAKMRAEYSALSESVLANVTSPMNEELSGLKSAHESAERALKESLTKAKAEKDRLSSNYREMSGKYTAACQSLMSCRAKRESRERSIRSLEDRIATLRNSIEKQEREFDTLKESKDALQRHIDVNRQMDTLVKRNFRGLLLEDIIAYVDSKAKEYCMDVFGTEELSFRLSGNDIDIEYCGKDFSSLSGGEQQKVNIIIQFAIRDMLERCLDFHSNILVLDEVYDNLDSIGVNNINSLISTKLSDIESVFIISHHADELQLPVDCEMTITKDASGISSVD